MGSVPSTYPGLDGHPRRITPIPMSTAQSGGTSQSTIGNTSILTRDAENIKKEVRDAVRQVFPGIKFGEKGQAEFSTGNSYASVIDLTRTSGESLPTSAPLTIAGSDVSVASTKPSPKDGGKAAAFSRLTQGTDAASAPHMFATTQWKPKEPPCYYGRSTEDVHTWTSLVRHYLTFMGGSDAQQFAYSVTLLRDSAHEWYIGYERRNRHPPRDWAQLCDLLLKRFGSNIRSQEAQSTLMAISQGQRLVRDYASQFETLLGRLDSYDESMMLNQFIWGLQPELARSVSLQYPKSIAQAVSLAETTELAVKASRRPVGKSGSGGTNSNKGPMNQNRGRGSWRGGRGRSGGFRGSNSGGSQRGRSDGGRRYSGRGRGDGNFDPLACYQCGVRGHLARDCPSTGTKPLTTSGGSTGPTRGSSFKSGRSGPRRGRGKHVRFGGMNVLYDSEGIEYPVDDYGQVYVPFELEQTGAGEIEEEKEKSTKN